MKKIFTTAVSKKNGQALVTLLFFIIIGITITTAAAVILLGNNLTTSTVEQGTTAYYAAESGIENALVALLRNPTYAGETMTIDNATVIVQVAQGNPIVITATGKYANTLRKIQANAVYNNNTLSISSWKEIN